VENAPFHNIFLSKEESMYFIDKTAILTIFFVGPSFTLFSLGQSLIQLNCEYFVGLYLNFNVKAQKPIGTKKNSDLKSHSFYKFFQTLSF
jgi:hypothetical protein